MEGANLMKDYKIAAIGEADSIIGFLALGVEIYPVTSAEEAAAALEGIKKEYGIIFITETVAQEITGMIETVSKGALPAIVLIPSHQGNKGYAMGRIRKIVERAVGADILMGKEGQKQ